MLDIVFFALIAGFIMLKLFNVIGRIENNEYNNKKNIHSILNELSNKKKKVVDVEIVSAAEAALPQKTRDVFDKIRKYEPTFDVTYFIEGVKKAFNTIIQALNKGDKNTLKNLLSNEIFSLFNKELNRRKASGQTYEVTVVGIKSVDILDTSIKNLDATIKVKIISEQIKVIKDKSEKIIDGSSNRIINIQDTWSFNKNIKKDSIWKLVAT